MNGIKHIKPGWYVLIALLVYSIVISSALVTSRRTIRTLQDTAVSPVQQAPSSVAANSGLWFPIPGAKLPEDNSYLPGSPRVYRRGENQGFDFYGNDAGIPIVFGQAVIASADATVIRADTLYSELSQEAWRDLLTKVSAQGANETDLNLLRGRQVWLKLDDDRILRYAHLSAIHPSIAVGTRVYRGQVIAYVGNSGTDDGVEGTPRGARLHFEIWLPNEQYFGQDMTTAAVRDAAKSLFVGP